MKNYLDGYLDILPQGQKSKVQDVMKVMQGSLNANMVTEVEFKALVEQIAEQHKQLTEYIPQVEKVDDRLHNQFFSKVSTDLNLMFAESQLIERAINSYDRLYDGILADLGKEIKALDEKINSLHLQAQGENGLTIKTIDLSTSSSAETDRVKFSHLFKDRDGSDVMDTTIERIGDASYLCLNKLSRDRIRDQSGSPVAKLATVDFRGTPTTKTSYPVDNAIDNSSESYWAEVVLVDSPINVAMDDISAGGALVKFTVTLPQQEVVNEISLTPFASFPVEICSVKYEEDIETFHTPKELVTSKLESSQTMLLRFDSILAKRFTFILRQKNYTKDTYMVRTKDIANAELWDKISRRETEVSLSTPRNTTVDQTTLDTYSGWDIYQTEAAKYEKELSAYNAKLQDYTAKKTQWDQQVAKYKLDYNDYVAKINELNRSYGAYGINYVTENSVVE